MEGEENELNLGITSKQRQVDESYEDYKIRLYVLNRLDKARSKGMWYWRSKSLTNTKGSWGQYTKQREPEIPFLHEAFNKK